MNEISSNDEGKKLKISGLAVISLVFFILAFVQAGISLTILTTMGAVVLCLLLIVFSVMFGIAALLMIGFSKKKLAGAKIAGLSIAATVVLYFMFGPMIELSKRISIQRYLCGSKLSQLGRMIGLYSEQNNEKYPDPNQWCDLLLAGDYVTEKTFVCPVVKSTGDGWRCHYAMNPFCEPNSPGDMVLLFETKGGWNQFGGQELLTFDNHKGKGCNVLFNDGHAQFIKPEDIGNLKWKVDDSENR